MPVLVTAQDLATHLNQTVSREQAEQILDMVEAVVFTEYGSDTPPVDPRPLLLLRQATLTAAARALTNPSGLASETIDGYSYRRDTTGMTLTTGERALIRAARGGAPSGGVVSVPLTTPTEVGAGTPGAGWFW